MPKGGRKRTFFRGKVAQLVRAHGSYPCCRGFNSPPCYQIYKKSPILRAFFVSKNPPESPQIRFSHIHPLSSDPPGCKNCGTDGADQENVLSQKPLISCGFEAVFREPGCALRSVAAPGFERLLFKKTEIRNFPAAEVLE